MQSKEDTKIAQEYDDAPCAKYIFSSESAIVENIDDMDYVITDEKREKINEFLKKYCDNTNDEDLFWI